MRRIAGFLLSVLVAYLTISLVLVVLSWTRLSLSALPAEVAIFPLRLMFSLLGTAAAGAPAIPLFLAPVFLLAALFPSLPYRFEAAGLLAAILFVMLLFAGPGDPSFAPPRDPINRGTIVFAILITGLVAGRVFHKTAYPETARRLPVRGWQLACGFLVAMLGGWLALHDRDGDALCPHDDTLRLRFADRLYWLPAASVTSVTPENKDDRLHIFRPNEHDGSRAARQAGYRTVYCQTAADTVWRVRAFSLRLDGSEWGGTAPALQFHPQAQIRGGARQDRIADVSTTTRDGLWRIERTGANLWITSNGPVLANAELQGRGRIRGSSRVTITFHAALEDGTGLSALVWVDPENPDALTPIFTQINRRLDALRAPPR
jgi:hypothetical protein